MKRTVDSLPADRLATGMGLLAILIWSSNIAVSRSLSEKVGALTAGSLMFLVGGALGCAFLHVVERRLFRVFCLPRAYLWGCGSIFVAYMICLYLAIGFASNRQQTLEVGLINYLWPGLTLLFSIPLLATRVRWFFGPGILLALAGALLAPLGQGEYSMDTLRSNLQANPLPYVYALGAAVLWGAYSPLSRRWAGDAEGGAIPLFALASGLVLGLVRMVVPETTRWSGGAAWELLFMALLPCLVAYSLWDTAMRRGNVTLVAAAAYLIPLLSTWISGVYLGVTVGTNLWVACGLIVAGAALCEGAVVRSGRDDLPASH